VPTLKISRVAAKGNIAANARSSVQYREIGGTARWQQRVATSLSSRWREASNIAEHFQTLIRPSKQQFIVFTPA